MSDQKRIDIDQPLWDQKTFYGRFRHFAYTTDPTTVLSSNRKLLAAKELVEQYRAGREPPGTTAEQVIRAKKLFTSAFHPDTGELQNFIGRMSFQLPGGCLITGGMLTFYRSVPAIVFWQWINQSFNALVNYTNRNAKSSLTVNQLATSYVMATSSALVAAIGCRSYWQRTAGPIMQRYVPFAAVATANCINIPLMRQQELLQGIEVFDADGKSCGTSRVAAAKGITQVVISRIVMACPGMLLLPYITSRLESKSSLFKRLPWMSAPFQLVVNGLFLSFMVPFACALFPQQCSIKTSTIARLDSASYAQMKEKRKATLPDRVYFNKGL